ncbi:TolC family protein [Neomoorella humiferrea]|uniref:TolC family protein n=1 Tax=Neomoorella humiferrea TaxID=676965 RepID=UPI003D933CB5
MPILRRYIKLLIAAVALICMIVPSSGKAGAEAVKLELTLEAAIKMALETNLEVKKADMDLRIAQEDRQDALDGYQQAESALPRVDGYFVYDPNNALTKAAESAYYGYLAAQAQVEIKEKQMQIAEDKVVNTARSKYYAVVKAQKALAAAKSSAAQMEEQFRIARAKFAAGVITRLEMTQAEQSWRQAEAGVTKAENDLEQAYRALNIYIGLPSNERPVLEQNMKMEKIEEISDMDAYIRGLLAQDPLLWQSQRNVDLQKTLSTQYGSDNEKAELKIDQARLAVDQYRQTIEETIPNIYSNIRNLEAQYEAVNTALAVAKNNAKTATLRYQLGMVTQAEILTAEAAVSQLEQQLAEIVVSHELLKNNLEKPWAAVSI